MGNEELFDDEDPSAIMGNSTKCATMADGSLRVQIDIRPEDAQKAFKLFGTPGSAVALARLNDDVAVEHERPGKPAKGPFGEYARALILSGFFRAPQVWENIGTDDEYLEWVRQQKSAYSGKQDYNEEIFESRCVPAHVRHVEHGSGTGIKPPYAAIPLTNEEHQLAHQKGDSALGDRDWWDKKRIKYLQLWAQETLKSGLLGGQIDGSWTDVPPQRIFSWAQDRELERYLPNALKPPYNSEAATESQAEGEA